MAISLIDGGENNNTMKSKLEETKMEIRKIKDGKKAYKGYNTKIPESILIDERNRHSLFLFRFIKLSTERRQTSLYCV